MEEIAEWQELEFEIPEQVTTAWEQEDFDIPEVPMELIEPSNPMEMWGRTLRLP
eukprot:CAMPEP_0201283050 /NCGR_PEP_ID=MMETSP1317-20130820/7439_1 /ASSEMBLY_ACC=CAM_ASM_000770 /TAXON_ID=187299 /ORGANISM="Undescribed Undescribed, Strain Undescribed" /LENGTH=53 /DNA_ID=CAMNT_0047597893 /DNA_START=105 /DNA_END=263 /DNA_ORIENTATION=-